MATISDSNCPQLYLLTCTCFAQEITAVVEEEGWSNVFVVTLPARCGHPPLSKAELTASLPDPTCEAIHLIGKPCTTQLPLPTDAPDPCPAILIGQSLAQHLLQNRAYLLTPGWLAEWPERLRQWGLHDQATARKHFAALAERLVLLDSGIHPGSEHHLCDLATFLDMPHETMPVGLDYLHQFVSNIVTNWQREQEKSSLQAHLSHSRRQTSEYAMALSMFNDLAQYHTEQAMIERILEVFTMLFAPQHLFYMPILDGQPRDIISYGQPAKEPEKYRQCLTRLSQDCTWTESGQGFVIRISHRDEILGRLMVDGITFPEYREHYMNLARSMMDVCSLAIVNARFYEHMQEAVNTKVHELKAEHAKVIQAGKLASLGEMATGVAHELNQPLTAMLFDVDYIRVFIRKHEATAGAPTALFSELKEIARNMKQDIARCTRIINHLRAFARASSGYLRPIHPDQPLKDAFSLVGERLKSRRINVQWHLAPDLPLIQGAPHRLEQVFVNLISNAEYAMTEMERRVSAGEVAMPDYVKTLSLTTRIEGNEVVIRITDNGCGIPPSIHERIFEPFFTTKPVGEGTGLGLSISYGIVREHGGEISYESEENAGTTFTLRFPIITLDH